VDRPDGSSWPCLCSWHPDASLETPSSTTRRRRPSKRCGKLPPTASTSLPLVVIGAFVVVALTGHATTMITGLAVSLQAAAMTVTGITAGLWIAYSVAGGLYGVTLAAAALLSAVMLSMAGIVVAVDSYGSITNNTGGNAEVSELPPDVRTITDAFDPWATRLAVSLQDAVLPITVITAGMWIAYSAGDGIYDAAVVATALLTILPILPILSIATNAMDSFVNMA
jgi:Na+/H+-translocating membrane pyrophosphatase